MMERSLLRRAVVKGVTFFCAMIASKVSGHAGIMVDSHGLTVAAFVALDLLRHDLVKRWPDLGPWLS